MAEIHATGDGFSFFGIRDPDGFRNLNLGHMEKINFSKFLTAFHGENSISNVTRIIRQTRDKDCWNVEIVSPDYVDVDTSSGSLDLSAPPPHPPHPLGFSYSTM